MTKTNDILIFQTDDHCSVFISNILIATCMIPLNSGHISVMFLLVILKEY